MISHQMVGSGAAGSASILIDRDRFAVIIEPWRGKLLGRHVVRGASWSTIAQACLFGLLWHLAIAFIPRSETNPWASVALAVIAAFFPIIVAVNWGYNEACRENR